MNLHCIRPTWAYFWISRCALFGCVFVLAHLEMLKASLGPESADSKGTGVLIPNEERQYQIPISAKISSKRSEK